MAAFNLNDGLQPVAEEDHREAVAVVLEAVPEVALEVAAVRACLEDQKSSRACCSLLLAGASRNSRSEAEFFLNVGRGAPGGARGRGGPPRGASTIFSEFMSVLMF